jgi:hypothetical protein
VFVLTLASPAWAQAIGTQDHETGGPTRIEIGAGFAGLHFGGPNTLAGVQARVNLSSRFAVDVISHFYLGDYIYGFDYTGPRHGYGSPHVPDGAFYPFAVYGFYAVQVHQSVGASRGRLTPFLTYGVAGLFEYRRVNELRITYSTGDATVFPAHDYHRLSMPTGLIGGAGVRARLARRVFLETGAQLIPIYGGPGAVVSVGVMVPIGRGRQR